MTSGVAIVALDLQRDFLEDGGRMPVARAHVEPLLASVNAAIDRAAEADVPVVYIFNAFPPSAWIPNMFRRGAAVAGSRGAELDPRVHVRGDVRFRKESGDAFTNPVLDAFLKQHGVKHLLLFGLFAGACVRATVRGALALGYGVTIVEEGVADSSDAARTSALAKLAKLGVHVVPVRQFDLDSILAA